MHATFQLGDMTVDVVRKDIKNIHLSVLPPNGRVRISAPARLALDTIRVFAISKVAWIQRQQQKLREQVKEAAPPLFAKWERLMNVKVERFYVQRMKTRWGSCNARARTVRLNAELAKKPRPCLEYIVVHELAHLLEPSHNARFTALMDRFMPKWRFCRELLNRLPVRHEDWIC